MRAHEMLVQILDHYKLEVLQNFQKQLNGYCSSYNKSHHIAVFLDHRVVSFVRIGQAWSIAHTHFNICNSERIPTNQTPKHILTEQQLKLC